MSDNPNMVFCRGCGQRLHVTALACPHCGAPQGSFGAAGPGDGIPRTFGSAITICLRKYADFQGRAPRAEYWWFTLFTILVDVAFSVVAAALHEHAIGILGDLVSLALLLPTIAVGARRLHDIDRSGWWQLLNLVPLVGWIIVFVWFCTRGTRGDNRFGPENGQLA